MRLVNKTTRLLLCFAQVTGYGSRADELVISDERLVVSRQLIAVAVAGVVARKIGL